MSSRGHSLVAGRFALTVVALAAITIPSEVAAYNGEEHVRLPDQAYQILNILRRGGFYADKGNRVLGQTALAPLAVRPSSVPANAQADWNRFVTAALAAPDLLENVLTGLPNPNVVDDCGGIFSPFSSTAPLANCRIGQVNFAPRRSFGENPNICYLRGGYKFGGGENDPGQKDQPFAPFFQDLQSTYAGAVLGFWATVPDDESNSDTRMFIQPTNILGLGTLKEVIETAYDTGVALLLAPVVCLFEVFSGGDCWSDALAISRDLDPLARADDVAIWLDAHLESGLTFDTPGGGAGLWHFETVAPRSSLVSVHGQFNNTPGIKMSSGTWLGIPDPLELKATFWADLTGGSVHPYKSQGISRYGNYADRSRSLSDWSGMSLPHVEFEPLHNLARYGWAQYAANGTARGLGWVLHAIGDATVPHHMASTVGYGHQPWEKYAGASWPDLMRSDSLTEGYDVISAVMSVAFQYWAFLDAQPQFTANTVKDLIRLMADETVNDPVAVHGRAFRPGDVSADFRDNGAQATDAVAIYRGEEAALRRLFLRAVGASVAFLVKASAFAPLREEVTPCTCPRNSARWSQDMDGRVAHSAKAACAPCGQGLFSKTPLLLGDHCVEACPADKRIIVSGECLGTANPACVFVDFNTGNCVPSCAPGQVIRDNRVCVDACPPGKMPDGSSFCVETVAPSNPACGNSSSDSAAACCQPPRAVCDPFGPNQCCTGGCQAADGLCQSPTGGVCVFDRDCFQGYCVNRRCVGRAGASCASNADCLAGRCVREADGKLKCPLSTAYEGCIEADCEALCLGSGPDMQCFSRACCSGACASDSNFGQCDVVIP